MYMSCAKHGDATQETWRTMRRLVDYGCLQADDAMRVGVTMPLFVSCGGASDHDGFASLLLIVVHRNTVELLQPGNAARNIDPEVFSLGVCLPQRVAHEQQLFNFRQVFLHPATHFSKIFTHQA
jgi:hypothetical protein